MLWPVSAAACQAEVHWQSVLQDEQTPNLFCSGADETAEHPEEAFPELLETQYSPAEQPEQLRRIQSQGQFGDGQDSCAPGLSPAPATDTSPAQRPRLLSAHGAAARFRRLLDGETLHSPN